MCSRILMSSSRYAENSFVPVYQFDFQSWMTPTRRPPGWIFCPIYVAASSSSSQVSCASARPSSSAPRPSRPGALVLPSAAPAPGRARARQLHRDVAGAASGSGPRGLARGRASASSPGPRPRRQPRRSGRRRRGCGWPPRSRRPSSTPSRLAGGRALGEREHGPASGTDRPRMCSTTSRALRGDVRTHLATALTSCRSAVAIASASPRSYGRRSGRGSVRVGANSPSLCPTICSVMKTGDVLAAVVDRDGVPDHVGEDRRGARPGPDHLLRAGLVHLVDAAEQPLLHERPFLT